MIKRLPLWLRIFIVKARMKIYFSKSRAKFFVKYIMQEAQFLDVKYTSWKMERNIIRLTRLLIQRWERQGKPYLIDGVDSKQWLALKIYMEITPFHGNITAEEIAELLDLDNITQSLRQILRLSLDRLHNIQPCPNCSARVPANEIYSCLVCRKIGCLNCMEYIMKFEPRIDLNICHPNCLLPEGWIVVPDKKKKPKK